MSEDSSILQMFEMLATSIPTGVCFYDASDRASEYAKVTYAQVRMKAASVAQHLAKAGVDRGGYVACAMNNTPEFIYVLLAAAYGGFSVVVLNTRHTEAENTERVNAVAQAVAPLRIHRVTAQEISDIVAKDIEEMSEEQLSSAVHTAQRGLATFDRRARAVIMFTSGVSGKPKAVALSWENLTGAARASNASLSERGMGLWQLTLPMFHIGGLQIAVRSLLNGNPFVLYRHFDPETILEDARRMGATHISVVDKMLRDLLQADTSSDPVLPAYRCVLLGGAAPNAVLLEKAVNAGVRVYASYGMTETSSQIASSPVTRDFDGALTPLAGYQVVVLAPDEQGNGSLAVKGPGVFEDYMNARAVFTADGYFITGDTARMKDRRIVVAQRERDMFVSGGENIYPEQIRTKLLSVPDVQEAHVFGVPDETWGRRPVAFVEAHDAFLREGFNAQLFADQVQVSLGARLAKIYRPDHVIAVPEFPRTAIGKVDRGTIERFYSERIQIDHVDVWRIRQPFKTPIRTAKTLLKERDSLIVRVTDTQGRTGIAEGVAFSTDWYLPETIDDDMRVLEQRLIPLLSGRVFMHPSQVSALFAAEGLLDEYPLACAAIEPAMWDVYGKVMGSSVRRLIGAREQVTEDTAARVVPAGAAAGGAVLGIMEAEEAVETVRELVDAGYVRVKIKVQPGHDVRVVRAVRQAFPRLDILLDANQSYTEDDMDTLRELDDLAITCIEEPLDPARLPQVGPPGLFDRLARLQTQLRMPVCLDESWSTSDQLEQALGHPELRCYSVKIAKFGGVQPALDFYRRTRKQGISLWTGGMFDTGVSKRLHAAFSMLPGITIAGDISDTSRYFAQDITTPPFALGGGVLQVNPAGYSDGLGCELDDDVVQALAIDHREYR